MRHVFISRVTAWAARLFWPCSIGNLLLGYLALCCSVAVVSLALASSAHAATWQTNAPAIPGAKPPVGGQPAQRATSATAAAAKSKLILGAYVGDYSPDVTEFEKWLGQPVDAVLAFTRGGTMEQHDPAELLTRLAGSGRKILWSIQTVPDSPDPVYFREAAAGKYDDLYYRDWANKILASRQGDTDPIYVRTSWEVGGDWFDYSVAAKADPEAFKGAFQHFSQTFHGVSSRFMIVWDFAGDQGPIEKFYPGDPAVDVISQDIYWKPESKDSKPDVAFNKMVNSSGTDGYSHGLAWMADFAAKHNKPMAISEWGVPGGRQYDNEGKLLWDATNHEGATFINLMKQWIGTHNVVYANYWDSDSGYAGKLRDNNPVKTANALRDMYQTNGTTPAGLVSGGTYQLLARHSGKALDVDGGQGQVQQWTSFDNNPNQQWVVEAQADGTTYKLTFPGTKQVLDVQNNSNQDGARVQLYPDNGSPAQRWVLVDVGGGYYKLKHQNTSKVLDVPGFSQADGVALIQYEAKSGNDENQQWKFVPVSSPAGAQMGTASPGPTAASQASASTELLSAYPNPTSGPTTLRLTAKQAQRVMVYVHNAQGHLVSLLGVPAQVGTTDFALPTRLPPGTYFLRATLDGHTQRFVLKVE